MDHHALIQPSSTHMSQPESMCYQLFTHTVIYTHSYLHTQLFTHTVIYTHSYLHTQLASYIDIRYVVFLIW